MSQKKINKPSVLTAPAGHEVGDEQIAVRAYERWMGRGCPISDGVEDWLAARQELEAEMFAFSTKSAPRRATAKSRPSQAPASMR
jgi:hypothetical protein